MTPASRTAALAIIGWSNRQLADKLGVAEGTIRYWTSGRRSPPPRVDDWLERLAGLIGPHQAAIAAILADNPPPARP